MIRLIKTKDEGNVYGFDFIDILQFNYDGKGTALARVGSDSRNWEIVSYSDLDLENILGLNEDEHPICYRVEII